MSKYPEIDIPLSKLLMDHDNPRHPNKLNSQREIIEWMKSGDKKIGERVFDLAKDIAAHGLSPTERVMVRENDDGTYTVWEGNRRLTALKLLNNPSTAPDVNKWQEKYKKLKAANGFRPIKKVPCVIVNDEDVAFHFIENKHLNNNGGAGVVTWGSEEKARHERRRTGTSRLGKALALLEHVRNSLAYDEITKELADRGFPITTLDRLLGDKLFREFLGLTLTEDGELAFNLEPGESAKPIRKIINDFGGGKYNVRDVINKEEREKYKATFSINDTADHNKKLKLPIEVTEKETYSPEIRGTAIHGTRKARYYDDPKNRKFLIIQGSNLPIDPKTHNRARRIYDELKKLPLKHDGKSKQTQTYPNAVAVLFRSFFEISINAFIEKSKMPHPRGWQEVKLPEKVVKVKDYMYEHKLLNKDQIGVINKLSGGKDHPTSIQTLNGYVHNPGMIPTADNLVDTWDIYYDLLSCIWEHLKS